MALRLLFLRHFETVVDPNKPASQWSLSKAGLKRSKAFVENWGTRLDSITSSPEPKAYTTAEALSMRLGAPLSIDPRLREVDRGGLGLIDNYSRAVELYLREDPGAPDWEPLRCVQGRAISFLKSISRADDNHLVVTHGLFMTITLSDYLNVDEFFFWRSLGFGQVCEVDHESLLRSLTQ